MGAVVSTGTTIAFGTTSFETNIEVIDAIQPYSGSRSAIQSSHFGTTTAHTFIPQKLYDAGELTFTVHYDVENHGAEAIDLLSDAVAETVTITYPDGNTDAFSAFATNVTPAVPFEDKMTCDITFKITGAITTTDVT